MLAAASRIVFWPPAACPGRDAQRWKGLSAVAKVVPSGDRRCHVAGFGIQRRRRSLRAGSAELRSGPGFPEARATAASLKSALERADPGRVVYLSTIGARARELNLLTQHTLIEQALGELPMPITFLRPAWFMENFRWDVAAARESGIIMSFLQPLNKAVPMVATADIGREAAKLLQESWTGRRVVELEGPRRVTPDEVANTFAEVLGRRVRMDAVPRETWEQLFRSQGMKNPTPRIRMLDGFNDGWIEFENGDAGSRKGEVALKSVLQTLVEREGILPIPAAVPVRHN